MNETHPSAAPPPGELTLLLRQFDPADATAAQRLYTLVYAELRQLAAAKMHAATRDEAAVFSGYGSGVNRSPFRRTDDGWRRAGAAAAGSGSSGRFVRMS